MHACHISQVLSVFLKYGTIEVALLYEKNTQLKVEVVEKKKLLKKYWLSKKTITYFSDPFK